MTQRKPKNQKAHKQQIEIKKTIQEKNELVTVKPPSHFPFQDLRCLKEHRELFEGLFGEK